VPRPDVADVFQRVLYPLLEAVISVPSNAETTESRLRASALLCKAFMKFEISDNASGEDVTELWMQVLDYLDRLMRTDQSDQLVRFASSFDMRNGRLTESRIIQSEAVLESLKNVILVMHAADMLIPPSATEHDSTRDQPRRQLWHMTHDKIERFMPGFMESVIPLSSGTTSSSIEPSTKATEKLDPEAPDLVPPQTTIE
jgi:golgi-specific brefeldin A-resistance guanine nucleotide exchange factor 1